MALAAQGSRHYLIIHRASETPLPGQALQSWAEPRAPSHAIHQAVSQINTGLVSHTPDLRSPTVMTDKSGEMADWCMRNTTLTGCGEHGQ